MTSQVRTLTTADLALLRMSLVNAGIKARVRKFPGMFRVVFEGGFESVAAVLNGEGFRHATGNQFDRFSFDGNQAFVRYMEA